MNHAESLRFSFQGPKSVQRNETARVSLVALHAGNTDRVTITNVMGTEARVPNMPCRLAVGTSPV